MEKESAELGELFKVEAIVPYDYLDVEGKGEK